MDGGFNRKNTYKIQYNYIKMKHTLLCLFILFPLSCSYKVAFPHSIGSIINQTSNWTAYDTIISPFLEKHFMLPSAADGGMWSYSGNDKLSDKFHDTVHGWVSHCAYKRDDKKRKWNHIPAIERLNSSANLWIFHEEAEEIYYEWEKDNKEYDPLKSDALNVQVKDNILFITGDYFCENGISMLIPHKSITKEDVPRLMKFLNKYHM